MTTSTLTQNGQTTIPIEVRRFLNLHPKHKIVYQFEGDRVILQALPSTTEELYGGLKTVREPPKEVQIKQAKTAYAKRKYSL